MTSTDFEERLREEMRHATTRVPAPSGLVRRARRNRRRRIVLRASAASAAAAAAVAGALIVSNGTAGASRDSGTYTTASVVKHVRSALAAVNEIAYIQYRSHFDAPLDLWVYDGPRGQAFRAEYFSLHGGQVFQEVGMTATPGNYQTYTAVYFDSKTWSRRSSQGAKPRETGCGMVDSSFTAPCGEPWGNTPRWIGAFMDTETTVDGVPLRVAELTGEPGDMVWLPVKMRSTVPRTIAPTGSRMPARPRGSGLSGMCQTFPRSGRAALRKFRGSHRRRNCRLRIHGLNHLARGPVASGGR
ncbi:MAG TPA: hypothetical protein VFQ68_38775 [Streptosporangiaceae bacterium]|nr:hypothetical protein [Streptosporangiaceae bacterium]